MYTCVASTLTLAIKPNVFGDDRVYRVDEDELDLIYGVLLKYYPYAVII